MKIHQAMLSIQRDIHAVGIEKTRRNKEQNFNFRGIDDALLAFAPLLTEHRVILSPRYDGITVHKRATKSGGATYNVKLHGTFTFTCAEDGSTHTVGPVYGEANDGQDKAVSKAESIALRQMFFIAFCVPHEPVIGGDPDAGNGDESADTEDTKAADWVRVANSIEEPNVYAAQRAAMLADYSGDVNKVPRAVKVAFSKAQAAVTPKDAE